jgi:flagellar biosynthesis protein FlhF
MITRTFHVSDLSQGLRTIKDQVGDDAIILSTQRQDDGSLEVKVGLDPSSQSREFEPEPQAKVPDELASLKALVRELKGQIQGLTHEVRQKPAAQFRSDAWAMDPMVGLRAAIARINDRGADDSFGRSVGILTQVLTVHGVHPSHVEQLLAYAFGSNVDWESDPSKLHGIVRNFMEQHLLTTTPLWATRSNHQEVAVIMGATGVGKTTTVAKIAAHASRVGSKKVGIICADTFRIGAAYQISTYAELLDLPIQMVSSPDELQRALRKFKDLDLVLIDTMGRNPWGKPSPDQNRFTLRDIEEVLDSMDVLSTFHLCVAASTRVEDAMDIARSFDGITPDGLIVTKLDESRAPGVLYSAACAAQVPISHVCDGPLVPEHIQSPTPSEMVSWVFRGYACAREDK